MSDYYFCTHCDSYMNKTEARMFFPEIHYELDEKPTEWISEERCIYCGSDELEEAEWCDECGELFPESQIEDGLCPNCREERDRENEGM